MATGTAVVISFGQLREKVKKDTYNPQDVLAWYRTQEYQYSKSLITFLKNQIQKKKKKKTQEVEKIKKEENADKRKSGKPRRRKKVKA